MCPTHIGYLAMANIIDSYYDAGNVAEATMGGVTYIANAFSLQMIANPIQDVHIEEISEDDFNLLKKGAVSRVGHVDTAAVLNVECVRKNITLQKYDTLLIAQLQGGRLPEGATRLPDGFSFKYYHITLI